MYIYIYINVYTHNNHTNRFLDEEPPVEISEATRQALEESTRPATKRIRSLLCYISLSLSIYIYIYMYIYIYIYIIYVYIIYVYIYIYIYIYIHMYVHNHIISVIVYNLVYTPGRGACRAALASCSRDSSRKVIMIK